MPRVTDHDIHEPVVDPVEMAFFTRIDPTGIGEEVKYPFRKTVHTAISTTARVILSHQDGTAISEGDELNDYYGFGDSLTLAIAAAEEQHARFRGTIDISVALDIRAQPVIITGTKPFYDHAFRGVSVPGFWRMEREDALLPDGNLKRLNATSETLSVWKNGERLEAFGSAVERMQAAIKGDLAGEYRRGALHVSKGFLALIAAPEQAAPAP